MAKEKGGHHPKIQAAGMSDLGFGRSDNQDAFLVDPPSGLFLVADGVGGHQGGAVAAQAVVTGLPLLLKRHTHVTLQVLRDAVCELNAAVRAQGDFFRNNDLQGMASTLAGLLIRSRVAYVAHMGDSRVYHWRDDRMTCLTADHSLAALLVREGAIAPSVAATHPGRYRLTRYIGLHHDVYPDMCEVRIAPGDRFMICSDGVWNVLRDDQMAAYLAQTTDPQEMCAGIVGAAKRLRSRDNITCVAVLIGE